MSNQALADHAKVTIAITPTNGAANTTDINGAILDTANYRGVLAVVLFGTITAGAVTSIKAQQGDASNMSDAADLAGTAQTVADTDDDKIFLIDLARITKRYVRIVVDRGTQNAVVAGAFYIQYAARSRAGVSGISGTNVAGAEAFGVPAEGTA